MGCSVTGFVSAVLLILLLGACAPGGAPLLERETLFELELGTLENQLDLLRRPDVPFREKTRMIFYDGLVFISSGAARKVMEFSSYGDLLTMHYNPFTNPQPVLLGQAQRDGVLTNRKAVSYPFEEVGEMALGPNKELLVEDRLPRVRRLHDEVRGVQLDRIILRFRPDGSYGDFLGQEGVGGTPFPLIDRIAVTGQGEIVVVSRLIDLWSVFWFDAAGTLVRRLDFPLDRLPRLSGRPEAVPLLEAILPDQESRRLYLYVTYIERVTDSGNVADIGVVGLRANQSRLLSYDVDPQAWGRSFALPPLSQTLGAEEGGGERDLAYEFLGTARQGRFAFLGAPYRNRQRLLLMNAEGQVLSQRTLELPEEALEFAYFHVAPSGVVSALLSNGRRAQVVWWRADRMLELGSAPPALGR